MTAERLGSWDNPYTGKAFKETMLSCLDALVNRHTVFLDADGEYRIHVKFANGRMAIVQALQEDQAFDAAMEPLLVHEVKYPQLRLNWTAVSAAIVFGIAFAFEYRNDADEAVRLVLYKSEAHQGDDFVEGIVAEMQALLEYDALGDLGDKMQAGFKRLEKLIGKK